MELARRGFNVTGVDRAAQYLGQARQQALEEGLVIEFVQQDMREFRRPGSFDIPLNLNTSFGYFEDPADDLQVLPNIHASLQPGGSLVAKTIVKEVLARIFQEREENAHRPWASALGSRLHRQAGRIQDLGLDMGGSYCQVSGR